MRNAFSLSLLAGSLALVLHAPTPRATPAAPPPRADVIHVPQDFPTIQSAINSASNGDTVVVAPGTYTERIDFAGKAITVRSSGSHCTTVIDGTGGPSFLPVVAFDSGEGPSSVLQGFTITGGDSDLGAGMYVEGANPQVLGCRFVGNDAGAGLGGGVLLFGQQMPTNGTFVDCEFLDNHAGTGGGMANAFASVTLVRCRFVGNTASQAGGLSNSAGPAVVLTSCVFEANTSTSTGGGLVNNNSNASIRNCIFRDNVADNRSASTLGGGIFHLTGSLQVAGCLFTGNRADYGAGLASGGGAGTPSVLDCTFSLNVATAPSFLNPGGAIHNQSVTMTVVNSILWNNPVVEISGGGTTAVSYCDVLGGHAGPQNINVNPQFVGGGSFRLQPGSLCIDSGNDGAVPGFLTLDLGGVPRIVDDHVDRGAYECLVDPCTGQCVEFLVDCNGNGIPDGCDVLMGSSRDCNGNFVPDECESPSTMDVVFIIDGSSSISPASFALQKQGIIDCLCGPAALIPTDGTAALAVIQFTDLECEDVPLTVVDSPATAAELCQAIGDLPQISGGTELAPALEKAAEVFLLGSGLARQVFLTTDAGVSDPVQALDGCRALGEQLGVKICTGLVGSSCPEDNVFLQECANAIQPPEPLRPVGSYRCIPAGSPQAIGALCDDCIPLDCPGDVDEDGLVGVVDLLALLAQWGSCPAPPTCCPADFDGNGAVDVLDLLALLAGWGPCPGSGLPAGAAGDPPDLEGVLECYDLYAEQPERLKQCLESKQ